MKDTIEQIILDTQNDIYDYFEANTPLELHPHDVDNKLHDMKMNILKLFKEDVKLPKNYLVHLKIVNGEFEKGSKHLIHFVDTEEEAIEYAIRGESHDREDNTPPDEYGWYEDAGGQLMYKVQKVVEVSKEDFEVLKKYI